MKTWAVAFEFRIQFIIEMQPMHFKQPHRWKTTHTIINHKYWIIELKWIVCLFKSIWVSVRVFNQIDWLNSIILKKNHSFGVQLSFGEYMCVKRFAIDVIGINSALSKYAYIYYLIWRILKFWIEQISSSIESNELKKKKEEYNITLFTLKFD